MASSTRTPHFSIARWPRDGKIHAPRALDALEAWPRKLTSYLMVPGGGNNHLYGGGKNHHGVNPLSFHCGHSPPVHFPVSLDASPLSIVAPPFAIVSSESSSTSHLLTPKRDSYSMTPEGIFFALMSAFMIFHLMWGATPVAPQGHRPRVMTAIERTFHLSKAAG